MTSVPSAVVLGPTASGKSDVAMEFAKSQGECEIVAADSMQVYRGMDIGTAKPTLEDRQRVVHHGIDIADPSDEFSVAQFLHHIEQARASMHQRGTRELIVGGTGLYVTALVDGLNMPGQWPEIREELEQNDDTESLFAELRRVDPVAASRMEPNNRRRIIRALEVCRGSGTTFSSFGPGITQFPETTTVMVGIQWDRTVLRQRIEQRVWKMMERGLIEEVRSLLNRQQTLSKTAYQALGYKEVIEGLAVGQSVEEMVGTITLRTQQFAVRQERWYRRDPRIHWVQVQNDPISEVTPVLQSLLA
ncbi:MAG: tRNA (adenosine(37)-N6)-dimethylallyltransferase MiaA [Ilumatobacteraceae bacterium]